MEDYLELYRQKPTFEKDTEILLQGENVGISKIILVFSLFMESGELMQIVPPPLESQIMSDRAGLVQHWFYIIFS